MAVAGERRREEKNRTPDPEELARADRLRQEIERAVQSAMRSYRRRRRRG